jgi:hypothetical protein
VRQLANADTQPPVSCDESAERSELRSQNGVKRGHRVEPTIETEYVCLKMLSLDTATMCSLDPTFQITENAVDHCLVRFGLVGVAVKRQHVMAISDFGNKKSGLKRRPAGKGCAKMPNRVSFAHETNRPLFRQLDNRLLRVADLDAAISFYRDRLGHRVLWRSEEAVGFALPDTDAELVVHLHIGPETMFWLRMSTRPSRSS